MDCSVSESDPNYSPCPECGKPKRRYVACEYCGYSFIAAQAKEQALNPTPRPSYRPRERTHHRSSQPEVRIKTKKTRRVGGVRASSGPGRSPLIVYDEGEQINESQNCSDCDQVAYPVWRFRSTSRGEVYLCGVCRERALARSENADPFEHRQNSNGFPG
jgi:ribosomal protein L32